MAETIKFTQEEINEINQLRFEVGSVFTELGRLHIEKKRKLQEIEEIENTLLQQYGELVTKEETLFNGLTEKYGDGDYDPNTGIFTPKEK
jgi:uncharacterized protein YecA (UPF0149 family)